MMILWSSFSRERRREGHSVGQPANMIPLRYRRL